MAEIDVLRAVAYVACGLAVPKTAFSALAVQAAAAAATDVGNLPRPISGAPKSWRRFRAAHDEGRNGEAGASRRPDLGRRPDGSP
ncbi:hypothetical protein [Nonomuraea sp. NPDC001699]